MFSGLILYLSIHIPAAKEAANLGGWSTPPGRLGTALETMGGTTPINYSILFMTVGIILIILGAFSDEIHRLLKTIKKDNHEQDN